MQPRPEPALPTRDSLVSDILDARPALGAVFLARGMACPGCAMSPFMTVGEAADSYGLSPDGLVAALRAVAAGEVPAGPFPPTRPHARTGEVAP